MNLEEPDHWLFEKKNNHHHIHMHHFLSSSSLTDFEILLLWSKNSISTPCFTSIKFASFLAGQKKIKINIIELMEWNIQEKEANHLIHQSKLCSASILKKYTNDVYLKLFTVCAIGNKESQTSKCTQTKETSPKEEREKGRRAAVTSY